VVLRIDVLTIFPALVESFLSAALVGSAREHGLVELRAHDLRQWTDDRHRTVDDAPYGGGPGMVMKPEPLVRGIEALAGPKTPEREARVILMSPQGRVLTQRALAELAGRRHLVLVCGRYEGVDQRVVELAVDEELSIGDYVLGGGEVPAMAVVEGVVRLVPGVLGNPESVRRDSFSGVEGSGRGGFLEGPQYTRPPVFRGRAVPEVLLSGDHAAIERFRAEGARERTRERRPDLLGAESPDRDPDQRESRDED
jgi:tRNA (guanine37-N1)-methyltransferase